MPDRTSQVYSTDELEYQELRAQQLRAKLLFHCYALADDADDADELDDAYGDYYAEDDAI